MLTDLQKKWRRHLALAACLPWSTLVFAQQLAVPDPGAALRRQQEQQQREQEQLQPAPDVRLATPGLASQGARKRIVTDESPCFQIDQIELNGDTEGKFQWLTGALDGEHDAPLHRCLGAKGIQVVLTRAQNALLAKGWVTSRVLVAPQDLSKGTLVLSVLPGRIGALRFDATASPRGTAWNAIPARPGDVLNLRDIEQGLENFKRVPTAEADIRIEPGVVQGDSDLVIAYQQGFPFRITTSLDDGGSRSSGKYQATFTLSYDNWWMLNDLFYVTFNHDLGGGIDGARGTRGNTVHYSVPYGYWMLGSTATRNTYFQTVAGATQNYIYSGTSDTFELKLQRLLYRDAQRKTTLSLAAFRRSSNNFIDDTEVQVQRRVVGGWDAGLNHKEFIGQATLEGNLHYKRGSGAFGSLIAPEEAFGEGTSRFALITADLNLAAPFKLKDQQFKYGAAWRMQMNRTPLTPQDLFSIGGRYTVRGFDGESSLAAERGWLLRNDFGMLLGASGPELYLGLDHGEVQGASSARLAGTRLTGIALALRGQVYRIQYDIFAARPVQKPLMFRTARSTAGFSLNFSY